MKYLQGSDNKAYFEFSGLSTDDKPTLADIATGSLFHEVDTTKIYAYEEESGEWIEQMQFGDDASSASASSALSAPLNVSKISFGSGLNTADTEPKELEEIPFDEQPDEIPQDGEGE